MKLDINEINHIYIQKIVIFSLFLHKRYLREPNVYKQAVYNYTKKRIPWKISLVVDTGQKLEKGLERELLLNELLDGIETKYLTTVTVTFTTPLKQVTMSIDLKDEDKYENFLYS